VGALIKNSVKDEDGGVVGRRVRAGDAEIVCLAELLQLFLDAWVQDVQKAPWDNDASIFHESCRVF
jgi:hypothetical protein